MANISDLLRRIATAIYGEDMREAIHDSIENVNIDVENHKTKSMLDHADGSVTDEKIGSRTVQNPGSDTGTMTGTVTEIFNAETEAVRAVGAKADTKQTEWLATTEDGDSSNNYAVTLLPAPEELYPGMKITIIPHKTSAGITSRLNVNGLGNKLLRVRSYEAASGSATPPYPNFLLEGKPESLIYNGDFWVLQDFRYARPTTNLESTNENIPLAASAGRALYNEMNDSIEWTYGELEKKADKANESGGFAGGQDAKAEDSAGAAIDAIQLGTGTNSTAKTLQVYDYQLLDADGNIPAERLANVPGGGGGSSVPVVDNLTSTSKISALSANQGRVLNEKKADVVHTHTKTDITDFPVSMTPTSHASTSTTYGVGTSSNYGHVKLADNLTTTTTGSALDARQGKALQDSKLEASNILAGDNINLSKSGKNVTISAAGGGLLPRIDVLAASGTTVTVTNGDTTLTKISTGTASFDIPYFGDWIVSAGTKSEIISVDTVKIYTVMALSLQEATWEKIALVSQSGNASSVWSVGDEKDITVAGETLTLVIVGFDHDDKSDGSGKAGITFGLKNLMATARRMEATYTNANSFSDSEMYTWIKNTLLPSFPSDLQNVIKFVDKKTSAGNKSTTIKTDSMKIFLFSEVEIIGEAVYSVDGEGMQYPYLATVSNRIKYFSNGTGSTGMWWSRSPHKTNVNYFCLISTNGYANMPNSNNNANNTRGVCFGFCV